MTDDTVRFERINQVVRITLNAPQRLNALSPEMMDALLEDFEKVRQDDSIRALILTGTGRAFCAGVDLKCLADIVARGEAARHEQLIRSVQELMRSLEALPIPTIAAVNGIAVAGGLELILCCDLVVTTQSARIGDGHARAGVLPGGGSTVRLPRRIPLSIAKELLFTGELIPAQRLQQYGLVNQVVADEELGASSEALAAQIANNSASSVRAIKQLIRNGLRVPQDVALDQETEAGLRYARNPELAEGLSAFAEHRAPRFK